MEIIRIRVEVDDKKALSQLNNLQNIIDKLNRQTVRINVDGINNVGRAARGASEGLSTISTALTTVNRSLTTTLSGEKIRAPWNSFTESTKEASDSVYDFAKRSSLLNQALGAIRMTAITAAINGVTSAFKNALGQMKEVDTQLTNIQKVSSLSASEIEKLGDSAYATASKYGVAASEYLSAVYTFQKAGLGDSAAQLGELATKTMLVGDTTADVASKFLISANAAWQLNGSMSALSTIVDEADYINNNYATSLDKLAAGFPIVSALAGQMNMSAEETIAALGTITSATQETGTKAATALRAIMLNILGEVGAQIEDGVEVTEESVKSLYGLLNKYAPEVVKAAKATGEVINPMEALNALSQAYQEGLLTDIELTNLLSGLGGKLRTTQLVALLKNFDMYEDMLNGMSQAAGTADKEIDTMLSSWESKVAILQNTWTEFIQKSISSDSIKGILDAVTKVIDGMDNLGLSLTNILGLVLMFKGASIGANIMKTAENLKGLITGLSGAASAATKLQVAFGWIGVAITAISALTMAVKQHREAVIEESNELAEQQIAAAANYKNQGEQLDGLIAKYKAIGEDGDVGQLKALQDEINGILGDQLTNVDLINGSYEEQLGILQRNREELKKMSQDQLNLARANAENALLESAKSWIGTKTSSVSGLSMSQQGYLDGLSSFARMRDSATLMWGNTAEEIISTYDQITTAMTNMANDGVSAGDKLYIWLMQQRDNMSSAIEQYKTLQEAYDQAVASGDKEKADEIKGQMEEVSESFTEAADEVEQAVNRITLAKQQLDSVLSAPSEDQAFTDISSALASFNQMVENGEIGSNAFWATAEFLAGPEVLKEYYGNAQGLIEYIKNSNLDEIFGAEGANGIVDALRNVDSAIASVVDRADGGMDVTIRDVDALSEALGLTKDQTFAALEALEKYGDFEYEGDDLVEYLDWLGVQMDKIQVAGEEIEGFTFSTLVRQLQDLGYNEYDIASVVSNLEAMGLIDLEDTEGSISDIQTEMGKASTASDEMSTSLEDADDKTMGNVQSEIGGVADEAKSAQSSVESFGNSLDKLNGKVVQTKVRNVIENVTTNTVTTTTTRGSSGGGGLFSGVKKLFGFAEGTSGAPGGPALVGDEPSRDGRPMPELILDNGNTYLAGVYGPEIVRLGKGATVFSNTETRNILSGNIPAYAFGNLSVSSTINKASTNKTTATSSTVYYKVTFSPNGGSGGPSNVRFARGATVTIPTTKPGRTGYYFIGWSRSSSAKRAEYQPKATVKFSGDVKLYAVWEKKPAATKSTGSGSTGSLYSGFGGGSSTTTTSYGGGGGGGGGGGSSYTSGGGGGGGGSADDPRDTLMDQINDELEDIEFKIWEGQKSGSMSNAQAIAAYKSAMDKINSYITKYQQMGENENSEYIQRLKKAWWSYSDEVEGIQNDLIAEMSDAVDKQLAELDKVKNERIAAINAAADAESNLNALEEKRLDLLEAQDALLNAQSQRTVRIYNAATGQWEWVADADAVKSAQESVESAQKALSDEVSAQARESQIEAIESEYEALTQAWEAIQEGMKNPGRPLSAILAEIASSGTVSEQAIGSKTGTFAESIAAAASAIGSMGAVSAINGSNIMYGASPNGAGRILMGGTSSAGGEGNVSYYINGVEISGDRAESMTIADLARSMSTLAIYNNS